MEFSSNTFLPSRRRRPTTARLIKRRVLCTEGVGTDLFEVKEDLDSFGSGRVGLWLRDNFENAHNGT